jgi:cytoskeleton protein RodZ
MMPTDDSLNHEAARSVGVRLADARRAKNITLTQVSTDLRIRETYLQAIEDGRFQALPGTAYMTGFLRSYSLYLGLDPESLLQDMRVSGVLTGDTTYTLPTPVEQKRLPSPWVIWGSVAGVLLVILVWALYLSRAGADVPVVTEDPYVPPVADMELAPADPIVPDPTPVTEPPSPTAVVSPVAPVVESAPAPSPTVTEAPKSALADGVRVQLVATGESWFQIRLPEQNRILASQVLKKGDTFNVRARRGQVIDVGNPPGLKVLIDGDDMGSIGVAGRRVRGLSLDADALRKNYFGRGEHLKASPAPKPETPPAPPPPAVKPVAVPADEAAAAAQAVQASPTASVQPEQPMAPLATEVSATAPKTDMPQ